jgi:pimeloyl-ACP methyl ester carboxylesterase
VNLDDVALRKVDLGDVSLAIREWGDGDPLLLVHGLGTHSGLWKYQATAFGERFRVVAVDLRGFGASDKPRDAAAYDLEAFVRDLERLLELLHLEHVHCLGTSMGGFMVQSLALRKPELVRTLVLAHTAAHLTIPADVLAARVAALRATSMEDYGRLVGTQALAKGPESPLFDWVSGMVARNDRQVYEWVLTQGLRDFDVRERLAGVKIRTLVVAGDTDRVIPTASSAELARLIPRAAFETLADAGHIGYAEQPERFNATVLSFLSNTTRSRT